MTKDEYTQMLMNRSACIQVGALLHEISCSFQGVYDDFKGGALTDIGDIADGLQAVKHIADILSDKVAGCAELDTAWESADKNLDTILTKEL